MRRIRGKETTPEKLVRAIVRELGFTGYRLHRRELPGNPDICFMGRKLAIQVHGCFWHAHTCIEGRRKPKSNLTYWNAKLQGNKRRDEKNLRALRDLDWKVLVVWECELVDRKRITIRISRFLQ